MGTADDPLKGNVMGTMAMPNSATLSTGQSTADGRMPTFDGATGTYTLCVTVDTMGVESNMSPIPATSYMGSITQPSGMVGVPGTELATTPLSP